APSRTTIPFLCERPAADCHRSLERGAIPGSVIPDCAGKAIARQNCSRGSENENQPAFAAPVFRAPWVYEAPCEWLSRAVHHPECCSRGRKRGVTPVRGH